MSFETLSQLNKKETWLSLADTALEKHETAMREILQDTDNLDNTARKLSDYLLESNNVTFVAERDNAEKFAARIPDFVSAEEEL